MTEINELGERLQKLEDAFNKHLQDRAMCYAHVQQLAEVVNRLDHTVYGNGKEGLTTITARMDERLASVQECLTGLPDAIDAAIERAVLKEREARAEEREKEAEKPSSADKSVKWFSDKVLPYFVTGAFIILLQAIWELVKIKLSAP